MAEIRTILISAMCVLFFAITWYNTSFVAVFITCLLVGIGFVLGSVDGVTGGASGAFLCGLVCTIVSGCYFGDAGRLCCAILSFTELCLLCSLCMMDESSSGGGGGHSHRPLQVEIVKKRKRHRRRYRY